MGSPGLRLLRTNADAGGFEQPQGKGACADPHGDRGPRHQAAGHDAHRLAGQKPKFSQPPPQFGRGRRIGSRTETTRAAVPAPDP